MEVLIGIACLIILPFLVVVGCKPCLFNIRDHRWVKRGKVDACFNCGLIKQKVEK